MQLSVTRERIPLSAPFTITGYTFTDMTVVVVRGEGTLTLGSDRIALAAGDVVVIPRDVPHWFANGSRTPAVSFAVYTPPLDAPDSVPANGR